MAMLSTCTAAMNSADYDCTQEVTMKVAVRTKTPSGRYKLTLADAEQKEIVAACSKTMTELVHDEIKTGCWVTLTNFKINEMKGTFIMCINDMKVAKDAARVAEEEAAVAHAVKQEAAFAAEDKMEEDADGENADGENAAPAANATETPSKASGIVKKEDDAAATKTPIMPKRATPSTLPRSGGTPGREMPINALNPYNMKWTIRARVTAKSMLREWTSARGQGKLFSTNLLDSNGTEIRATFFNEAVDKFYDQLHEGSVYTFTRGRLKVANTAYTSIKNNYEITFGDDAIICTCDDDNSIKTMHFNFVKMDKLEDTKAGSTIDVLGVIHSQSGVSEVNTKSGKQLQKRDLVLVDDTMRSVRVTLWGNKASEPDANFEGNPTVALKGCKLSDYGGRSIGTYASTLMVFNPAIEEATGLRNWYEDHSTETFISVSASGGGGGGAANEKFEDRKMVGDIDDLGMGDKPDFVTVKATITLIKTMSQDKEKGPWYAASPDDNKKVIQRPDGTWFCESTQKAYDKPEYRWILPMCVNDSTGNHWGSAFNDMATLLVGKSANEMFQIKQKDPDEYEKLMKKAFFQTFVMRLRVKEEYYQEKARKRVVLTRFMPMNYKKESKSLITAIQAML